MNLVRENPLVFIGKKSLTLVRDVGGVSLFIKDVIKNFPKGISRTHLVTEQMLYIGVNSIPLVILTSLFTGAVTSVQAAYQFSDLLSMRYLGSAVAKDSVAPQVQAGQMEINTTITLTYKIN